MAGFWDKMTGNSGDIAEDRATNKQASALMQQSYIQSAAGLAALWEKAKAPQAAGAVIEGGKITGETMAKSMQERYFKKEFELVRKTKVAPILQSMQDDVEKLRQGLAIATRPIQRTVNAVDGQMLAETVAGGEPTMVEQPTGKKDKDGKPLTQLVPQAAPPAPNPALGQGQIGAVETYDALSIVDPSTGLPVDLSDPRAIKIHGQFTDAYWDSYGQKTMQLLDLFGEYAGNPFADQAAKTILEHTTQLAGQAATAETNPQRQAEVMLRRQKMQADIDQSRAATEESQLGILGARGGMAAGARFGRAGVTEPGYEDVARGMDPALLSGDRQPSPQEQAELSGLYGMKGGIWDTRQAQARAALAGIAARQKAGLMPIPISELGKPDTWPQILRDTDPGYKGLIKQRATELANGVQTKLEALSPDERAAAVRAVGADINVQEMAAQGMWRNPQVQAALEQIALSGEGRVQAENYAIQNRFAEIARTQDGVRQILDQVVDQYIAEARSAGHEISPAAERMIRADGPRVAAEYVLRRPIAPDRSPVAQAEYNQAYNAARNENALEAAAIQTQNQASEQEQFDADADRLYYLSPDPAKPHAQLGSDVESAAPDTDRLLTRPRQPRGATPAPGQPIGTQSDNAEPVDQGSQPVRSNKTNRPGPWDVDPDAPIPRAFRALAPNVAPAPAQSPAQPIVAGTGLPFGFKPPNPYFGQDPELLMNILTSLPPTDAPAALAVRNQIKEAIEAAQLEAR